MSFKAVFKQAMGEKISPYPYQQHLADEEWPELVDISTGLGKTAAISLAWVYKRGWRADGEHEPPDDRTPRRLIWCLPMRVLVEQTETNIREWLGNLAVLGEAGQTNRIAVHTLMGGDPDLQRATWAAHPGQDAVLIGTQDMLLSRALMRGYGMSRYQWPVHFSLLHNDALWVFDEVQLMGPALATTTQIEAFRRRLGVTNDSHSIWCSATLQPDWLGTVDFRPEVKAGLSRITLSVEDHREPSVTRRIKAPKSLLRADTFLDKTSQAAEKKYIEELADQVLERHQAGEQSLVILNRVERAQGLYEELGKRDESPNRLLLHARFRPHERREIESWLRASPAEAGRIVVATQAVEAGVDIDSRVLFTELAPWSSLVQRFGRCNRAGWHERADVFWIDLDETAKGVALPYEAHDLAEARDCLTSLETVSPAVLPAVRRGPETAHVLRRRDLLNLFNTDPDLSGFDVDVSPYIRDTGTPQVQVFWRQVEPRSHHELPAPERDELCPVSLTQIREHLGKKFPAKRTRELKRDRPSAWRLDPLGSGDEPRWELVRSPEEIRPGQQLLLAADEGGYRSDLGFVAGRPEPVASAKDEKDDISGETYASDRLSCIGHWVPLGEHLCDVADDARSLGRVIGLEADTVALLEKAARWHDVGKAHEAFQRGIGANPEDGDDLWAKSDGQGRPDYHTVGPEGEKQPRRYFRHELASMLAWNEHAEQTDDHDLIAYLIAAHHGRVRTGLRALPDENEPPEPGRPYARGIWHGDQLPAINLGGEPLPETTLHLDLMRLGSGPQGPSWTERTQHLLNTYGPFQLAWLESLLRIADWQASAQEATK